MKTKPIHWVTAIILIGMTVAAIGAFCVLRSVQDTFTNDAVQVIAADIHLTLQENNQLNDADINARIKFLSDASVIHIRLNKDGEPLDMYGNNFQVTYKLSEDKITVTCASAGPDGKCQTADDIICTYDGTE